MTTTTPLADLKRELAEALRTPCPKVVAAIFALENDDKLAGDIRREHENCPDCGGRGYAQPLMRKCSCLNLLGVRSCRGGYQTGPWTEEDAQANKTCSERCRCKGIGLEPRDFGIADVLASLERLGITYRVTNKGVQLWDTNGPRDWQDFSNPTDPDSMCTAIVTAALAVVKEAT